MVIKLIQHETETTPGTKQGRIQRMLAHEYSKTKRKNTHNKTEQFFIQPLDNAVIVRPEKQHK